MQAQARGLTASEIVAQLEPLGTEGYRRILRNHGVADPIFGVKVEELKKIQKIVKKDYQLAKDLYATGIYDIMYLGSLIADEAKMTPEDLEEWVAKATCDTIAEYAAAWVAAEGPHGWELGRKWIDAKDERTIKCGWQAISGWIAVRPDSELDIEELRRLLHRVRETMHSQPDRVRYAMNGFVISVGAYVVPLHEEAIEAAKAIGKVEVDMGNTSCKVPFAPDYIQKIADRGTVGKKRKMVRC
jgi:3-methyladenine DNA glycosylase AlkD